MIALPKWGVSSAARGEDSGQEEQRLKWQVGHPGTS